MSAGSLYENEMPPSLDGKNLDELKELVAALWVASYRQIKIINVMAELAETANDIGADTKSAVCGGRRHLQEVMAVIQPAIDVIISRKPRPSRSALN